MMECPEKKIETCEVKETHEKHDITVRSITFGECKTDKCRAWNRSFGDCRIYSEKYKKGEQ